MMIMSHCGISVVINVRLCDSQDALKMGARRKTCLVFYIITPYMFSDWELCCTRDRNVHYHGKYMNGVNTGVFKKNSVCSSTHPHENSSTTSVYIEKATYKMNYITLILLIVVLKNGDSLTFIVGDVTLQDYVPNLLALPEFRWR